MANYTSKYNLTKPLPTDLYDIEVFNENMDIIDAALSSPTPSEILSTTSITDAALAQAPTSVKSYAFSGESYSGTDLPSYGYKYGTATVYKRYGFATIVLWGAPTVPQIAVRYYNATTSQWSEWSLLYGTLNEAPTSKININYSTTDLTAGQSELETGEVYLVYE